MLTFKEQLIIATITGAYANQPFLQGIEFSAEKIGVKASKLIAGIALAQAESVIELLSKQDESTKSHSTSV